MLRKRLLRLYPRAWRERYGAEFLAIVEEGPQSWQQVIDIISGAIDARLSSDVRRATVASRAPASGGGTMVLRSLMACESKRARFTKRDSLVGAGVMLGGTLLLTIAGMALRRSGWPGMGEILMSLSFPFSLTLSMPFWMI